MRDRKDLALMVVLYVNAFCGAFNNNVVNVALNSIMADFDIDAAMAQWLVSGFMIVTLLMVTSMAFLYRRFSLRSLFITCQCAFILGGVINLLSSSFPMLMAGRLVQGVGTGLAMPLMMNTVLILARPERRGIMVATGSTIISLAPAISPVVSGLFVTCFGWHSVFVVPTFLAVVELVAGFFLLRNVNKSQRRSFDPLSALLLVLGLVPFAYGLTQVVGETLRSVGFMALGAAIVTLFALRQGRIEEPLVKLSLLRDKRFWPSCVLVFISLMTTLTVSVLMPLYLQSALDMTAAQSGLCMLVPVLFCSACSIVAGRRLDAKGPWPMAALGFLSVALGQFVNCLASGHLALYLSIVGACLAYAGVGFTSSPSRVTGLGCLDPADNSHGTALQDACVQLAGCLGPALYVGIANSITAQKMATGLPFQAASASGISLAFAVATAVSFLGFLLAFFYTRMFRRTSK